MSRELHDWGAQEGLSPDIITLLLDQGFSTLANLRHVTPNDVMEFFQKTNLLPLAKCLALRNAIGRLSRGAHPPYSPPERGYSPAFEQETYTSQGTGRCRPHHGEPGLSAAMGATTIGGQQSGEVNEEFRLLLLGKTGSGKSTTGNTIFGEKLFQASADFGSVTADCELKRNHRDGRKMEVMDSPGLFDTSKNHEQVGTIIIQSVAGMHPGPNAILYVVRVGRYTAEEYSAYNRLKALFDDSITRYMIVLFTGGDDLLRDGQTLEVKIRSSPDSLKKVLSECNNRCVLFDNNARDPRPQVKSLLDMVRQLDRQNGGPYVCPKYIRIGESLEAEVARRMEQVDKKELERQKYVQQLQQKTEDTQQALSTTKKEMERKEREHKRQVEQLAQQQQQQTQLLRQQMKEQNLSNEKRLQEERALRERQQEEQQKMEARMEQQRREYQQRFQEMEEERQRLEAECEQKEREMKEERGRRHEREMNKLKDEVVEKADTGFLATIGQVVNAVVSIVKIVTSILAL